MLKNYFKIAWRNLWRNKGFAATNLLGLTIGITCTILIFLWVQDELGYNKFHARYNNIYKVYATRNFNNQVFTDESMVLPLAQSIESGISQVKQAAVITNRYPVVLSYGNTRLKKEGYTASEHFFDMFSWKFVKGSEVAVISDPSSIVLTASTAKAVFGNEEPVGKTVRINNEFDRKVTAVVADVPGNSTLQFDYIMPFNYSDEGVKRSMSDWTNSSWSVFVEARPGASMQAIDKAINAIKYQHDPSDKTVSTYFTFPMRKWRLYSDFENGKNTGGMISYVRLFSIIAVIILLIACVNFMNLSTARSERRAKEVGVRKTLGSGRKQLVFQFFSETIILAAIAFVLSVSAVYLLLPSFNNLVDKQVALNIFSPQFWVGAIVVILFTGLVAGSYPALYLSSFNPVKVLKGTFSAGKKTVLPRHILIVGQFVISIILISATIIIYQQIRYIRSRDMGYNPDNLIMIPATPDTQHNFAVIKDELLKTGKISAVTRTFSPVTDIWWKSPAPDWEGKPANADIIMAGLSTDVDFSKTMGVKILEGKDFSGMPSDSSAMLLNEAAVKAMGLQNPVGKQMRYGGRNYTVIGITGNIVMESPFRPVDPMMVYYRPENCNSISVRLAPSVSPQLALPQMEAVFKKYNPSYPFEYQFVDEEFGKKFLTEELISRITNIFAFLAIFICCIGLAGLASFTIEKRIREIGIRKVLGASVQQLLMLISKEFVRLVLIAFVISFPLAWWFMNDWLEKYAFRIHISAWLFAGVGLLTIVLTLLVVSLNTVKAALANPVKSLRTE